MALPYPGNDSSVKDLAYYCASVANDRGLPPILPIQCAAVELTSAWTSEGTLDDIPGFLNNVDACSVGLFQQQADDLGCGVFGWGTYEQCIDVPYSLNRFLDVALEMAEDYEERHKAQTDRYVLGEWIADVQRPLADYRYRYGASGYDIAYPLVRNFKPGSSGNLVEVYGWYGWESESSWSLVYHEPGVTQDGGIWQKWGWFGYRSKESWDLVYRPGGEPLFDEDPVVPPAPITHEWPVANDAPIPDSPYYAERNPTRYSWADGGRTDVEDWAWWLIQNYDCSVNTYHHHPEEVWLRDSVSREYDSFDVWASSGRGGWLDSSLGDTIFRQLMDDPNPPNIEWIIYKRYMYGAWNNWEGEYFGDGSEFTNHDDHVHVTYRQ